MRRIDGHAIVLGASMAGLATAAVLAGRYDRVTVVDRDELRDEAVARRGVPQGRLIHVLFPGGLRVLQEHLPGLTGDLVAAGAVMVDAKEELRVHMAGGWLCQPREVDDLYVSASRPLIETVVRRRVQQLPNVVFRPGHDVRGLVAADGAVHGVQLLARRPGSAAEVLGGDLVVDATGRGSRSARWVAELGYPTPEIESVDIGVRYAARRYRREAHHLDGAAEVVVSAIPSGRGGMVHVIEDDQWLLGLIGYLGDAPPDDEAGFEAFAASLDTPDLHQLIRAAEPVGEIISATFPASQRRRFDRLERFPDGLVVLGDAMCSFNPTYGQGMSVAAIQAGLLGEVLDDDATSRIGLRFFARARAIVDAAWDLTVSADLELDGVDGSRTRMQRLSDRYGHRVTRVAQRDPIVCEALYRVVAMTRPPESLLAPRIAWRVLRPRATRAAAPSRAPARTPDSSPVATG